MLELGQAPLAKLAALHLTQGGYLVLEVMELDVDHLDALLTLALLALPQAKEAALQVTLAFHRGDLEGAELHHEQEHVAHDAADGVGAALQPVHAHPR